MNEELSRVNSEAVNGEQTVSGVGMAKRLKIGESIKKLSSSEDKKISLKSIENVKLKIDNYLNDKIIHFPLSIINYSRAKRKRIAFTLAEVLITLAIIGVVAAMTMPVLIGKYQKHVTATRLKSAYSKIFQAVRLSENNNGEVTEWDYTGCNTVDGLANWFEKYFSAYLKYLKIEKETTSIAVYLADGSIFRISPSSDSVFHANICINGKDKDEQGKDCFLYFFGTGMSSVRYFFRPNPKIGFYPYDYHMTPDIQVTNDILLNDTTYGCNKDAGRAYCALYIMNNGWTIPNEYPYF